MANAPIGMLGLGDIGLPIAAHLAERFVVVGFDPKRTSGEVLEGVRMVSGVEEVAGAVETLLLCLPSPAVSREVVTTVAQSSGTMTRLIIELSTIGPEAATANAQIARDASIGYMDAPVSGNVRRARIGELTAMAAGDPRHVAAARPVLDTIATNVFVLGDRPGMGQSMKLANNIINAASMAVTSEAIAFGTRMGLDMATMVEVLNVSTGRTTASTDKFPTSIVPGTYSYGARGEILAKDASLFCHSAEAAGVRTSVARAAEALWADHVDAHPEVDISLIYKHVAEPDW